MASCNDGAAFAAGFVRPPTDLVLLLAGLHQPLIFVPGTDPPNGIALRQLVLNESDVLALVWSFWKRPDTGKDEEQAPKGTSRLHTKVTNAMRAADSVQPIRQLSLVAVRAIKSLGVVISNACEIGKFGAKNVRNQGANSGALFCTFLRRCP